MGLLSPGRCLQKAGRHGEGGRRPCTRKAAQPEDCELNKVASAGVQRPAGGSRTKAARPQDATRSGRPLAASATPVQERAPPATAPQLAARCSFETKLYAAAFHIPFNSP